MDRTDNQLRACVKALNDVIGPALDPSDAQAAEQLFMVTDYLGYLRSHLERLLDRDRFEVRHYVRMGSAILEDATTSHPATATALGAALDAGRGVLERPDARTPELKAAAGRLAADLREVVRATADADPETRRRIQREVLRISGEKIEADRAWHLAQGLEPDPESVIAFDEAIGLTAR